MPGGYDEVDMKEPFVSGRFTGIASVVRWQWDIDLDGFHQSVSQRL